MATLNPLEQKARSSFIKGIILTAVVALVIVALLGMQIYKLKDAEKTRLGNLVKVLVLKGDVYSGQIIDSSLYTTEMVDRSLVPPAAINSAQEFADVAAMDEKGNEITINTDLYENQLSSSEIEAQLNEFILRIKSEDKSETEFPDEGAHQLTFDKALGNYYYELSTDGDRITTHYFVGEEERNATNATTKKENAQVVKQIHIAGDDNIQTPEEEGVYPLTDLGNNQYYYTRNNQRVDVIVTRKYVTLAEESCIAKIDLNARTILIPSMLAKNYEITTDDMREEEYNMILLPSTLQSEETVDIRLQLPTGENYIVLSKKRVTIPMLGETLAPETIKIRLNEAELLTMSSAIVDAYKLTGSKLYAVKYVEPGLQQTATVTYTPSRETITQIQTDPNVVQTAREELFKYYGRDYAAIRDQINKTVNAGTEEERKANIEGKISTEVSTQKSERQQFLQSLAE